ncbi:protein mono-ADP-ribosyltransferase PARP11-like [Mytilus edulis]
MVELSKDNKLYKDIKAIWEDCCDDSNSKELKRIERLESLTLWEDYGFKRSKLFHKASTMRGCFPSIERVPDSSGPLKTMARQQSCLLQQLSSNINEVYLFCLSSDKEQVDSALVNGVAMRKEKFGYGVYFTDKLHLVDANSSNDEDKEKKMILARVSLGEMCVLQRENEDMSFPPCKDCNFDNCIHGRRYDSVIGFSNSRNFIIYERSQAYPEYIITYE